jgi:hypothetical protein
MKGSLSLFRHSRITKTDRLEACPTKKQNPKAGQKIQRPPWGCPDLLILSSQRYGKS